MIEQIKAVPRLLNQGRVILSAFFSGRGMEDHQARAIWQQKEATRFLNALKIKVQLYGDFPLQGLLVCNHLSYLDIILIASQGPVVFVAKSDLSGWPLIGNLLRHAGTILAYRNQPIKSAQTALEIRTALSRESLVVLFPEGTSTNGESVLPFRSPFFQPAHEVSALITPAAIAYTSQSGNPKEDICYWGDHTFFSHLMKLATVQGIVAHLNLGETQPCCSDRKKSAVYFQKEVSKLHLKLNTLIPKRGESSELLNI